jgi:hypothetical protein
MLLVLFAEKVRMSGVNFIEVIKNNTLILVRIFVFEKNVYNCEQNRNTLLYFYYHIEQ